MRCKPESDSKKQSNQQKQHAGRFAVENRRWKTSENVQVEGRKENRSVFLWTISSLSGRRNTAIMTLSGTMAHRQNAENSKPNKTGNE